VLWGVLLYVDRLTAMHAQHGERVADRVFRSVARVLQASVDDPGRWVRVGYGELLYPMVGASVDEARREAERLVLALQDHPWEDPIREVTLTGALVAKAPAESAQDWLHRARLALQEGRSKHGRGRVYVAT
jgi:GGDEF domain-containing protein